MTMTGTGGHFVGYAVLAALLYAGLPPDGRNTGRRRLVAVVGSIAFGDTDELHQASVPGRGPALFDIAVDALGAGGRRRDRWPCSVRMESPMNEVASAVGQDGREHPHGCTS
jgi:hypothetical protein